QFLRRCVQCAYFQPHEPHVTFAEAFFNLFHQTLREIAAPVFRRDADSGDVSGVIRFDKSDYKSSHDAAGGDGAKRDRLRSGEQVIESLAAVSLTVDKAALIEPPAFIE